MKNILTRYHSVQLLGSNLAIQVNYEAKKHIIVCKSETVTGIPVTLISISPSLANSFIQDLNSQLEWYKSNLYQWAKRKTNPINKYKRNK